MNGATGNAANLITYTYDSHGNETSQTNELGHTSYMGYNAKNLLISTIDARATGPNDYRYQTTSFYDTNDQLYKQIFPKPSFVINGKQTYVANAPYKLWTFTTSVDKTDTGAPAPLGLTKSVQDENKNVTKYQYDTEGDVKVETRPSGVKLQYHYDGVGRVTAVDTICDKSCANAPFETETTTYDNLGTAVQKLEPRFEDITGVKHQSKTVSRLDDDDNVIEEDVVDVGGSAQPDATRVTKHGFDNDNVENSTTEPNGDLKTKTFDDAGNPHLSTDAGVTTRTEFDAMNRPYAVFIQDYDRDPEGHSAPLLDLPISSTGYDPFGRKKDEVGANGKWTHFTYDDVGNQLSATVLGGNADGSDLVAESDGYDNINDLTTKVTGDGKLTTKSYYDEMGRLYRTVEDPGSQHRETQLTLDGLGNPLTKKIVDGNAKVVAETDYTYNSFNKPLTESRVDLKRKTTYTYDPRGNRTSVIGPIGTTTYIYDAVDHQIVTKRPSAPMAAVQTDGSVKTAPAVPTTHTDYNTFDEVVETVDAGGRVTTTVLRRPRPEEDRHLSHLRANRRTATDHADRDVDLRRRRQRAHAHRPIEPDGAVLLHATQPGVPADRPASHWSAGTGQGAHVLRRRRSQAAGDRPEPAFHRVDVRRLRPHAHADRALHVGFRSGCGDDEVHLRRRRQPGIGPDAQARDDDDAVDVARRQEEPDHATRRRHHCDDYLRLRPLRSSHPHERTGRARDRDDVRLSR